jgi:hypothetical protein
MGLPGQTMLGLPFAAERAYSITTSFRFSGIKITAMPDSLTMSAPDLNTMKYFDWRVAVWIQAVIDATNASINPLMLLQQEIISLFAYRPLGASGARCVAVDPIDPIDKDRLVKNGVFTAGLVMTFRFPKLATNEAATSHPVDDEAEPIIAGVSDAVVAVLGSATLSIPFQIEGDYDRTVNSRFAGIMVTVLPETLAITSPELMLRKYYDWRVAVRIMSNVGTTNEEIDPLMLLQQQIMLLFAFKPLKYTRARCIAAEVDLPVDRQHLVRNGLFMSEILFTFRTPKV